MNIFVETLNKYWKYPAFRPLQEDIIRSVYEGNDTLALLPTGGGKSITFQVPAMAKEGVCLVVTPLIALMLDQVQHLKAQGIAAEAIYSGLTQREISNVFDKAAAAQLKFLYLSPERLKTELFKQKIKGIDINFIAVDESHCISQWGYDFRPSYLEIANVRDLLPDTPIIALTASATKEVVKDIQEKLNFKKPNIFRQSFFRDNLVYIVRKIADKNHYLLSTIQKIAGSGIVYVRNRRKTYEIAKFLYDNGISADYYHAGLQQEQKERKQRDWQNGRLRVIVSTNAFGMGIDKSDVRFVIHLDLPDSLEAYYQEAGRGGRDGAKAYAGIFYDEEDVLSLKKSIDEAFPPIQEIKMVYKALGNFFQIPYGAGMEEDFPFDFSAFVTQYNFSPILVINTLKLLEREGWLFLSDNVEIPSKIHFLISNEELYRFYIANPDFEGFVRVLLRSYQGLFSSYVAINEHKLAKAANVSIELLDKYFRIMKENAILDYIPKKSKAHIRFLQERIDEKYLHISASVYSEQKKKMQDRIDAMLHFVESKDLCRNQILLQYFGEENNTDCNICDICVEKKDQSEKIEIVKRKILQHLQNKNVEIQELEDLIPYNRKTIILSVRELLDEKKIKQIDGKYELL